MTICAYGTTALDIIRASGRLVPELLERPRTSRLEGGALPSPPMLRDEMGRLGAGDPPYHLAFASPTHERADIVRHLCRALPPRSLIRVSDDVCIAAPELAFCQMAAAPEIDAVDLAVLGFELCGTYLVGDTWDGLIETSACASNVEKLGRCIDRSAGAHGIKKAREALPLICDGSNSPMETVLALLIGLPRRYGGLDLGPLRMNRRMWTPVGTRWVDVMFEGRGVGLEYKGRRAHSIERVGRDDRRQNTLAGVGVTIINVWYEDIADSQLFQQLVSDIARALKIRLRIRSEAFAQRQLLLRARLLPAIRRYTDMR